MTHNWFSEEIRLIGAPLFKSYKAAQKWLNNYGYKEYCWIKEV